MHNASVTVPAVTESFLDNHDYLEEWEGVRQGGALHYVMMAVLGLVIVIGGFCNISTIVILIRRRLWLQNEGYIYLLAILISNIVIVVIVDLPHLMTLFHQSYHVGVIANAVCKIWHYLAYVVFSTGWYVVALLLGVYLRDRLTRGLGPRCCQRLAAKYCTLTGSKVVVGVISGVFAVMNLWQLWSVELMEWGNDFKTCQVEHDLNHYIFVWEHVALFSIWVLPVIIIVPGLLVAILWTRRGSCAGVGASSSGGGDGFSHRRMNEEEEDGQSKDDGGFARASLLIGLTVYLLESPVIVVYICMIFDYHEDIAVAYDVTHILAITHLAVVPLLCLTMIASMRKEVQLATAAGECCPCRDHDEDYVMGILQMDSMAEQSSTGTA